MKFIEENKHRNIEKSTMELAMSWYHRYTEKEEQIQKIEQCLINFEESLHEIICENDMVSVALLQALWNKTIKL